MLVQTPYRFNQIKERLLFLSPVVQSGLENELRVTDFRELKKLGAGAFGKVSLCQFIRNNVQYAIKALDKNYLKMHDMVGHTRTEVKIMYELHHENIIKLYTHFEDDTHIYLVLEYAQKGQLYEKLNEQPGKRFPEKVAAQFIREIISALEYLHAKDIVHRDLKPENVLLDANDHCKLADFGWSAYLRRNEVRQTYCGTVDYLAPEMLTPNHLHDRTVDVWSVGVLMYELLCGRSPFAPDPNRPVDPNMIEQITKENIQCIRYGFPPEFPQFARSLVSRILVRDSHARLALADIRNDKWFKMNEPPKINIKAQPIPMIKTEMLSQSLLTPQTLIPSPQAQSAPQIVQQTFNSVGHHKQNPSTTVNLAQELQQSGRILTQDFINSRIDEIKWEFIDQSQQNGLLAFKKDELKNIIRPDSILPEYVDPLSGVQQKLGRSKKNLFENSNEKIVSPGLSTDANSSKSDDNSQELHRIIAQKERDIDELKQEILRMKDQFIKISSENQKLVELCHEKDYQLTKVNELDALNKKVESLKQDKSKLKQELEQLNSKLFQQNRDLNNLISENNDLKARSGGAGKSDNLSSIHNKIISGLNATSSSFQIKEKEIEMEGMKNKIRDLELNNDQLKEEYEEVLQEHKRELDKLKSKYEAFVQEAISKAANSNSGLAKENADLRIAYENLTAQYKNLEKQLKLKEK